jgi:octaprenyl-diphosphate synthase
MTILNEINDQLSNEIDDLNAFLKKVTTTEIPLINTLSSHMIDSGGKRIRPIIVFLISKIMSNEKKIIESAAIIELIHAATLLHDDVVDQSDVRHNINTANKLWGNDSAVLVGDFLYSRAFELIVEINRERVYKILAETTNKISQGEVMQLMYKEKIIEDKEKYIEIVYLKTGKLFEASALVAMDIAGSSNYDWAKQFGKNFGIAYQLRNDYLDYFGDDNETGKNIAEDLSEGKSTLPLIHSYINSNTNDKSIIENIFNNKILSDTDKLREIFIKNGSDKYTLEAIDTYTQNAIDAIRSNSSYEKVLIDLTRYCSTRTR